MKSKTKRLCAAVLSVVFLAMSINTASLDVVRAEELKVDNSKIVYYDFKDYSSTIINDASGNGKAAVMRNYDAGGFQVVDANIYGNEVKALSLPGESKGGYLEFPEGILSGLENATISMWVNLSTDTGYQRIWDFGNNTTSYMYLLSDGGNDGFKGYSAAITTTGWSAEKGVSKESNINKNRWVLTTVVIQGTTMTLYENGTMIGSTDTKIPLSSLGSTTKNWIGYGQFGDDPTKGMFAEVSIYNYAMTQAQVSELYNVDDAGIVAGDYATINLGNLSGVTSDIGLPLIGANGSSIAWSCNCSGLTISNGVAKVTRPAEGTENATGVLSAVISYGTESKQKDFPVTVLSNNSDKSIVEHDILAISFVDLDAVISNLALPTKGGWGSTIAWSSSNAAIATEGIVTRPDVGKSNIVVELTATAYYGSETKSKIFTATVIAKRDQLKITDYEAISVKTTINNSPLLPNFVKVTYSDGTSAKLKTIWPTSVDASQYSKLGTFTVAGKIIDEITPIEATVTVVEDKEADAVLLADNFNLTDISLEGSSILTDNMDRTVAYLKLLDNKRMLYNFYKTFGQTDKITGVTPLGGWDEPSGLLRGHSTGHYMSALALAYASTGDKELKTKLDDMVHELRVLQQMSSGDPAAFTTKGTNQSVWSTDPTTWGEGFISAYSPDQFALLEVYTPYATIWAPYYTLHKIMSGLLDAYEYTGNEEALEAAKGLGEWVYKRLSACSQEQLNKMWDMYIAGEFGGFNEAMARLYKFTGNEDFLAGAKLFNNTKFFNNLEKNLDDIQERHANQHIPQIVGALEVYEATVKEGTAEARYYNVANNFWNMVVSRYAYSIGGVGRGEKFKEPYQLANNIESESNCETCAAYNMLKLTKMLYKYDPDNAEYMDYYERTLYNQIIASQNPEVTANMHNGTTYMLPIGAGSNKSYGGDYDSFTCCHGTGMENHVKYQEAAYYKSSDTLYVNLYIPTTLTWEEEGIKVVQDNNFPSEHTQFTVSALEGKDAKSISMKFRVPYWATKGYAIKLNGAVVSENPEVSTYVEVKGIKAGDIITIDMPFTYHLDKTADKLGTSTVASVMYGPLVMVTEDSSAKWKTLFLSDCLEESIKTVSTESVPALLINNMTFKPMYDASNYAYHTYFKVLIGADDGKPWYDVSVTNSTDKFGKISVNAETVKEGGSITIKVSPNEGYMLKKLTVNGKEVTVNDNNVYVVEKVSSALEIVGSFKLMKAPIPDPTCLDQTALPSAHFTASWEKVNGINNAAFEPTVSKGGTGKGWGNWPQDAGSKAWVMYEWDTPVTMDKFQIFWYDDGGDTAIPATISFDYLDELGNWKPVTMLSTYADIIAKNKYNTINIEKVTGTAIRINMTIAAGKAATGIYRWKVTGPITNVDTVTVSPAYAEMKRGATQKFTATVKGTNAANQSVAWAVSGSAISTISSEGLLSVSETETSDNLIITATSLADTMIYGSAVVAVTGAAIIKKVSDPIISTNPVDTTAVTNDGKVYVTIVTAVTGAAIYYTVDNSRPDSNSALYNNGFELLTNQKAGETLTVKAIAIMNGWLDSNVLVKTINFLPVAIEPTATPIPTTAPTPSPVPTTEPTPSPVPTTAPTPSPIPTTAPTPSPVPTPTPIPTTSTLTPTPTQIIENVPGGDNTAATTLSISTKNNIMDISVQMNQEQVINMLKAVASTGEVVIPITSQHLIDQMNSSKVSEVNIAVDMSKDLLTNSKVNQVNLNLQSELLKAAKNANIDVNVSVKDETGKEMYTWQFDGQDLANTREEITDVNLSLSVGRVTNHVALSEILSSTTDLEDGLIISFNQEGTLPARACVRIYVGNLVDNRNSAIYLYHYNSDSGKLETLPYSSHYYVDSEGYITINLLHCSEYVILPKAADRKVITSLLEQIKVTTAEQTLYVGGTNKFETNIKVMVPSTLEIVPLLSSQTTSSAVGAVKVTYQSSNNKVATVDSSGKITAVGVGTASITTTIHLYSNKSTTVTSKITVKEPYIKITNSTATLKVGDSFTFKAKAYGVDADNVVWNTTQKSILVIDKSGKATAISKGTDYVKVQIGGVVKTIKVIVK